MILSLTACPSKPNSWGMQPKSWVRYAAGANAMTKDRQGPGASISKPANDNGLAGDRSLGQFRTALIPLVRLLARQAARDWLEKTANDNRSEPGRESPKEE